MAGHADRGSNLGSHSARLPFPVRPQVRQLLQINRGRYSAGLERQTEIEGLQRDESGGGTGTARNPLGHPNDLHR